MGTGQLEVYMAGREQLFELFCLPQEKKNKITYGWSFRMHFVVTQIQFEFLQF